MAMRFALPLLSRRISMSVGTIAIGITVMSFGASTVLGHQADAFTHPEMPPSMIATPVSSAISSTIVASAAIVSSA
jgi:hypothetical protein